MEKTEELLAKCSELALTMSELETEVPKLKKYFAECKKLHKELCARIQEDEHVLDQHFATCQQNLENQMKKIAIAIKKYEKTYEDIVGNESILKVIQESIQTQEKFRKKINELEERLFQMENTVCGPGTLLSVIQRAGYNFPVRVHKEGPKGWTDNYYFEINCIDTEAGLAHGKTYIERRIHKRQHSRNLDEEPFVLFRLPDSWQQSLSDSTEEELPFN